MTRTWMWLLGVVGIGAVFDQATKAWADANLRGRGIVTLVDGLFDLRYVRNPGAFFGLGGAWPAEARRFILATVACAAAVWIVHVYRRAGSSFRRLHAGLALLLAGAVGNLIDRVRHGEVVDFLHLHLGDVFHWATFNFADVYIALGLVLLAASLATGADRGVASTQSGAVS